MTSSKLLLPLWLVACGQTASVSDGGLGNDGGDETTPGGQTITLTSLDDVCDGVPALTGTHVLAILQPYYQATFTPLGAGSPSALEIFFSYTGGALVCHTRQTFSEGPPDRPAAIDVTVHAQLATKDGLFQEAFDATVTLHDMQPDTTLEFQASEPVASIQGTFVPAIAGTWSQHDMSFSGQLFESTSDAGTPGSTTGSAIEQASSGNMGQTHGAGSWK